ncbi:MAG: tetratricopeptide repeat protein, partial [Planctomycetota bacterium]
VRTSPGGREFRTAATWPAEPAPLQTPLGLEMAKAPPEFAKGVKLDDIKEYLDVGCFAAGQKKIRETPPGLAADWDRGFGGYAEKLGVRHREEWFVAHMYGWFYCPRRLARTFRLSREGRTENIVYFLVVDGQVEDGSGKGRREEGAEFEIRKAFNRGPARVDVYVCARRDSKPRFKLLCDRVASGPPGEATRPGSEGAEGLVPCPAEMFDAAANPEIAEAARVARGKIAPGDGGSSFDITFPENARARVIRLVMADFETDAPALNKIGLWSKEGGRILPTEEDLMSLGENAILEIVPGDRITVTYEDPKVITRGKEVREAFMTATFTNATIRPCFARYTVGGGGERSARYIPMRRFRPGDRISVLITDPDEDATDQEDVVPFTARTEDGGTAVGEALETDVHSGVFEGAIFPVKGQPKRKSELSVNEGDAVHVTYVDKDNVDYGIRWERSAMVEQVWYKDPELRIYDVVSRPLPEEETAARKGAAARRIATEYVPATRTLVAQRPTEADREAPASLVLGGPLIVEVLFPTIALSPESKATIYAQTTSGRKLILEATPPGKLREGYDLRVPGTIKIETTPKGAGGGRVPPGYKGMEVVGDRYATTPLDDGRFTLVVPMELAKLPDIPLVEEESGGSETTTLAVRGDDEIFIGFEYEDKAGQMRWLSRRATLTSDVFFDVMDRRYQKNVESAYVGETIYFRILHKSTDVSDEKDRVKVTLSTPQGGEKAIELVETFEHTGVFKGLAKLTYRGTRGPGTQAGPDTLAVKYGDVVTIAYRPEGREPVTHSVLIYKGADGLALPFTKQFKDPKIAVQTQFTIAESFFELAKKHRKLGQESLARREMAQAKKLLDEAVRDYPAAGVRAQAEFLLANLTYEFADLAVAPEIKKAQYAEAIARLNDIVVSYPDSPYAPKAQFKKALVFEKMGEIDTACEEYVKLSYRYPDNELVAETIARLGQYFLSKGKALTAEAKEQADPVEQEKIKMRSRDLYRTSAEVFG